MSNEEKSKNIPDCEKFSKMMVDRLADELSDAEISELDSHLDSCDKCRAVFCEFRKIWDITRNALKNESVPEANNLDEAGIRSIFEREEGAWRARSDSRTKVFFYYFRLAAAFAVIMIAAIAFFLPAFSIKTQKALGRGEIQAKMEEVDMPHQCKGPPACPPQAEPPAESKQEYANSIIVDGKVDGGLGRELKIAPSESRMKLVSVSDKISERFKKDSHSKEEISASSSSQPADSFGFVAKSRSVKTFPAREMKREEKSVGEKKAKDFRNELKSQTDSSIVITMDADISELYDDEISRPALMESESPEIEAIFADLRAEEDRMRDAKNGIPFLKTVEKPFSTFSIDVDTASYTISRKKIREGYRPSPETIRPEEFINYFDYHYSPPRKTMFSVSLEAAPSPFRRENWNFRIGVQARRDGIEQGRGLALTFLVDSSGSMAKENRLELVKNSLPKLFEQLNANDIVSVIVCREEPEIIANNVPAGNVEFLKAAISMLKPGGVADIEKGIIAAYKNAVGTYLAGASNKVVIISDGITNIGNKSPEKILESVDFAKKRGITNTVVAVGGDGDDRFLETIADKGDGSYVFISDETEAENVFVNEFVGRFHPIAKDVKIQVEFNPELLPEYRQIGYRNRQLSKADFRDDKVDAGDVGAGQSVTALYEMKLDWKKVRGFLEDKTRNLALAVVRVRYCRLDNLEIEEKEFFLDISMLKQSFEQSEDSFKLAVCVAEFAEFLEFPHSSGIASPEEIRNILKALVFGGKYSNDGKALELYDLIGKMK